MKAVKEHIAMLIDQLPEEEEQLFVLPQIEAFPDLLYYLAQQQQVYYPPEALEALSIEAPFEFALLLNKFLDALEIQGMWLASCKTLFAHEAIGMLTESLLKQQAEKLAVAKEQLELIRERLPQLKLQSEQLASLAAPLEAEEVRYQALVDQKAELEKKLKTLRALEATVKEGKLEKLSADVAALEKELHPQIQKQQSLETAQQQLIAEQAERQKNVQSLLVQMEALAQNRTFLDKLEADLFTYNQTLEEQLKGQFEQIRIRLEFNRDTSGDVVKGSLAWKLSQLLAQLEEIEKDMAGSIDPKSRTK